MSAKPQMFSRAWARKWGALALLCALIGLLNAAIVWTSKLAEGEPASPAWPLAMELTGAGTAFLLLPILLWFMERYPIQRENWGRRILLHVAATVPIGVTHTLLMWGSRILLFSILGWGRYDYGLMRWRFLMEYQKQFLYYWGIFAAVSFVRYLRLNRERELRASRLEQQLTEARLNALKMQLNPHFLFNTLNTISSYVHRDPDVADRMITRLSDFLRLTLRHSEVQEIPLEKEMEFLEAYVEIMKARFQERLEVSLSVTDGTGRALVPHMILQPLVENSISHCTGDRGGVGRISVSAARDNGSLRIVVEDNGPGIDGDPGDAVGRGVGLTNTAARLSTLYGDGQRLDLANLEDGGLRLTLEIPWRTAPGDSA